MRTNILPTITELRNIKGKKIILRLDFNVPLKGSSITDTMRIDRAIPTIEYLRKKGARIAIISHIGKDASISLKPVFRYLNKHIAAGFAPDFRSDDARAMVDRLPEGGVVLFENLRLDPRETKNDPALAKHLASLADIYVNDAFAVSHRTHASVVGITKYLPSYAGFLIVDEVKHLSLALHPKHPFLFILGGAKFATKMPLMQKFLKIADHVFVGGILANDFFRDKGLEVGKSFVDRERRDLTRFLKGGKVILPEDVVVRGAGKKTTVKGADEVGVGEAIMDVGPETIRNLTPLLKKMKLIVWNGPLGFYEQGFDKGTVALLKAIAQTRATSIIGGGDTAAVVGKLRFANRFSFVSTGGGATLDFLVDGKLPGIEAIKKCKKR